jgi:hypothetical protein
MRNLGFAIDQTAATPEAMITPCSISELNDAQYRVIGFEIQQAVSHIQPMVVWRLKFQTLSAFVLGDVLDFISKKYEYPFFGDSPWGYGFLNSGSDDYRRDGITIGHYGRLDIDRNGEFTPSNIWLQDAYSWFKLGEYLRFGRLPWSMRICRYPMLDQINCSTGIRAQITGTVLQFIEGMAVIKIEDIIRREYGYGTTGIKSQWPLVVHAHALKGTPSLGHKVELDEVLVEWTTLSRNQRGFNYHRDVTIQTGKVLDSDCQWRWV